MDRWIGKVAVVTGASSGIGAAIVKELAAAGMIVIGLARREDRLEQLKNELNDSKGQFHFHKCDVSDLNSIKSAFSFIKEKFQCVHVLVSNAGIIKNCKILDEGHEDDLSAVINTNFMGSIFCIKEAYNIMKGTGEECHIISINSITSHYIPFTLLPGHNYNLYPSTKYGLKAAMEVLRQELSSDKNFRVSSISPGFVRTEICHAANSPVSDKFMACEEILEPEDIAKAIKFVIEMPKHVQISELIIKPTGEKF